MSSNIFDNITRLNKNVRSFGEASKEYYKLVMFEKGMKGATGTVKGLLVAFFLLFAVNFLSLGLAVLISEAIGVPSSGFFIVGGIYILLICLVLFVLSKYIDKIIISKASRKVFNTKEKTAEVQRFPEEVQKFPEDERV